MNLRSGEADASPIIRDEHHVNIRLLIQSVYLDLQIDRQPFGYKNQGGFPRAGGCVKSAAGFSFALRRPSGGEAMSEYDLPPLPSGEERPLSLAWISNELLLETQSVWSEAYGKPISEDDAIEILQNVKRLAEVLLKAKREMLAKETGAEAKPQDREAGTPTQSRRD